MNVLTRKIEIVNNYSFLGEDVLKRLDGLFIDIAIAREHLENMDIEIAEQGGTFKNINGRKKFNSLVVDRQRLAAHANYLLDRLERIARGAEIDDDDGLSDFE